MLFEAGIKTVRPEYLGECWRRTNQEGKRTKREVCNFKGADVQLLSLHPVLIRNHGMTPAAECGWVTGSANAVL